ncbi:MAG: LysR family transcriptional regulator [Hyphomicrobiales bacterium]
MHSLHHLELVNALAKYRHFGRAADELGISQPALSKGLNHLESSLGVKLFARVAPIVPTPFGEIILQRSNTLVAAFEELLREIELAKGFEVTTLRIASGVYPAEMIMPEAIAELSRQAPLIRSALVIAGDPWVIDHVANARSDVGLADIQHAAGHAELSTEPIGSIASQLYCRAEHPLTRLRAPALADLLQYPFVGPSIPESLRDALPVESFPFGLMDSDLGTIVPRIQVETYGAARRIVMASDALSVAPSHMLKADIAEQGLAALSADIPALTLSYGFIWRRGRSLSPVAQSFMRIVRSLEAQSHGR